VPYVAAAISPAFSVAANSSSANIMAGSLYEVLARPSIVEFGLVGSAVGLLATVMVGGEVIVQDQEISGANRFPVVPDDWIIKHAGRAGSKIYITLRNRTVGALTAWVILNITPVG
jgi:hypothetical protein